MTCREIKHWRPRAESNCRIAVLQTAALPLCYSASWEPGFSRWERVGQGLECALCFRGHPAQATTTPCFANARSSPLTAATRFSIHLESKLHRQFQPHLFGQGAFQHPGSFIVGGNALSEQINRRVVICLIGRR